jgi:hypothetical protein
LVVLPIKGSEEIMGTYIHPAILPLFIRWICPAAASVFDGCFLESLVRLNEQLKENEEEEE